MQKKCLVAIIAAFFFAGFTVHTLAAQEEESTVESSRELELQISSAPEIKFIFTQKYVFPFLQGNTPLTEDNNISLFLKGELAPVSLNGNVTAVWTPIAFLEFSMGGLIGTGWGFDFFGSKVYGIGINRSGSDNKAEVTDSVFAGMVWKIKAGAAFQFDLGAVFPGDWNHVVFRAYQEIYYSSFTRAKAGESWFFENDYGENVNGFVYYANYVIGYQMPLFINFAALMAEPLLFLYDTPSRSVWGDDLTSWIFTGLINFNINPKFDIILGVQFHTVRNYTEPNWEDLYYRNRTLNASNPRRLEFYRAAAILTYKL